MKKLILTSAFILVSIVSVLAQSARPGQPIGGIVVGGSKPTKGNGIAIENPLFDQGGNTAVNPIAQGYASNMDSAGTVNNPYYQDNGITGDMNEFVDGNPIGGIIVKGAKAQAINTNPLYEGNSNAGTNVLYKGND